MRSGPVIGERETEKKKGLTESKREKDKNRATEIETESDREWQRVAGSDKE